MTLDLKWTNSAYEQIVAHKQIDGVITANEEAATPGTTRPLPGCIWLVAAGPQ
jgi:hypothetical protein